MKIKCPKCHNFIQSKIGRYKYKESGLNNVFLQNIPVYKCSCGISFASIFRVSRLNELITQKLLEKPTLLNGEEIKFLRKSMYMSSKDFAKGLGVEKTTISKWENGSQQHREAYDRSIRFLFMINTKIKDEEKNRIIQVLQDKRLKESNAEIIITAEKEKNDYVVNSLLILGGLGQKLPRVWLSSKKISWSSAARRNFTLELSHTKSDKMFSSQEVLSTKTSQISIKLM